MLQNMKNLKETQKSLFLIFPNFSRNILTGIGEDVTPKRSPKRRGPTKRYAPETTDVTPVKKPESGSKKGS
jgi:hypothetical protein